MLPRTINLLLACCGILIAVVCGLLLYIAFDNEEQIGACGNVYEAPPPAIDYIYSDNGIDGNALFKANCAICHHPMKDLTGPALDHQLLSKRTPEWLCKFLTDKDFRPTDDTAKLLRQRFGLECLKYPQMSCEEVNAIILYSRACIR